MIYIMLTMINQLYLTNDKYHVKKDMSNALSSLPCSRPNLEYPAVDQSESQFHYRGVDQYLFAHISG